MVDIGIAYRADKTADSYIATIKSVKMAGGNPVLLDPVCFINHRDRQYADENGVLKQKYAELVKTKPYGQTNVEQIARSVPAIIFPGGEDVSPSLYNNPTGLVKCNSAVDLDAARDVSDFILMNYCLDHQIPHIGICRGMEMFSIISGAKIIQDISLYFKNQDIEYNYEHKTNSINFCSHDVEIIDTNSHLFALMQNNIIKNVPSLHHQAVICVNPDKAKITAVCMTNNLRVIEAVERADSQDYFSMYTQYHPEIAAVNSNSKYMSYQDAISMFIELVKQAQKNQQ